jgi:mono/diheme cytochrome c family protein
MAGEDGNAVIRKGLSIVVLAAGLAALAVGVAALWQRAGTGDEPAAEAVPPAGGAVHIDAGDAGLVALGRKVYAANCATCHGAGLEGEPDWRERKEDGTLPAPPHDESGHTWHHPDGMLFTITRSGGQAVAPAGFASGMPGFAGALTDREISASIAFIKSRWPREIRRRQQQITRQSQ